MDSASKDAGMTKSKVGIEIASFAFDGFTMTERNKSGWFSPMKKGSVYKFQAFAKARKLRSKVFSTSAGKQQAGSCFDDK